MLSIRTIATPDGTSIMEAGEWVPTTSWSLVERLQDAGMLERSTDYSESDDDCEELPPVGLGAKFDLDASLQVLAQLCKNKCV